MQALVELEHKCRDLKGDEVVSESQLVGVFMNAWLYLIFLLDAQVVYGWFWVCEEEV